MRQYIEIVTAPSATDPNLLLELEQLTEIGRVGKTLSILSLPHFVRLLRAYQAHKDIWSSSSYGEQRQYIDAASHAAPTSQEHAAYQRYLGTSVPVSAGRKLRSADDF